MTTSEKWFKAVVNTALAVYCCSFPLCPYFVQCTFNVALQINSSGIEGKKKTNFKIPQKRANSFLLIHTGTEHSHDYANTQMSCPF